MRKPEESLCKLWDSVRRTSVRIGVPEAAAREEGAGNLFEEMTAENFPNPGRELDIQVHEANRSP